QADQQLPSFEIRAIRSQKDAPFAATVVSGAELQKANNGQDIPFMLQHTPSAVVTSDAGAGIGYTGLRIRGTDGSRINVTLNGVPVNDAESQGTFFVNFGDLGSSVSSIQIQRGVGTSTNGAAAFGATMSISNLELRDTAGVEVAVNAGSFNTSRYTLKAGTGMLQGGWQFDVRLSKIASDGFIDRSSSNLKALQLNAGWRISPATQLKAMVMTGTERTGQAWNGVPEEKLYGTDSALLAHYYNNLGSTYFTTADSINLFQSGRRTYNGFTYKGQTDNYQQDYYQLFADHAFSSKWTGGAGIFLTRGKGYYEEMKQDQDLENYGLPVYVPAPGDTVAQSDLIRQLWLDNYYYGTVFSLLYRSNRTEATFGGAYTRYDGTHFGELKWGEAGVPADHRWYT
ncbi:MAG: TonB-dependent receptor, partial [Sphingobacteriales bacterium]